MKEIQYKRVQFCNSIYMKFKSKLNLSIVIGGPTFLQPSVLILSRLTLRHSSTWPVCSWAAASSAHRLAICSGHTEHRQPCALGSWASASHRLTISHRRDWVPLKWVPGGFHSPPPTWHARLCSPSQELAQSRKTCQHMYLHAVNLQA